VAASTPSHVLALSGGVGGAKLALGLARVMEPAQLTIVANTADDFEHLGLHISPDLDTVMYTLAGLNNTRQGWGLAGETWQFLDALEKLGGETWFRLGDRDLATHVHRSQLLRQGLSLSEVTAILCRELGVSQQLLPMTDDPVRTVVVTGQGELSFQHYFVREQCEPRVSGFRFDGVQSARPQPRLLELLASGTLSAIVLCPSNPFVSVDPMLSLPGMREAIAGAGAPVIAVSPIVGGRALKGPAAKMMAELGLPASAEAVARHYRGLVDTFVLDEADAALVAPVAALGMNAAVAPTIMESLADRENLARRVLSLSRGEN
jgi:LPPG:FO 2-phospho-L-lactate transferase